MKMLIFLFVYSAGLILPAVEYSSGEQAIIEHVAEDYNVQESDVTLSSPNLVTVDLGTSSTAGVASFYDCGSECTRVVIDFPDNQLDFMIIEELGGI